LFWFLLGMLTSVAILCVLLPWLRTIPRFESLPALPWQAPLVGLLMIGAALGLYRWIGHPELVQSSALSPPGVSGTTAAPRAAGGTAGAANAGSMQSALASLKSRLAKGGGSDGDWELLAKSYDFMGEAQNAAAARRHELPSGDGAPVVAGGLPPEAPALTPDSLKLIAKADRARADKKYAAAVAIYAQLAKAGQMNADSWADYADAAGSANEGKLSGPPEAYIAHALELNPRHPKALWLKASADEEAGRLAVAIADWQALQALLPTDSPDAKMVAANLKHDSDLLSASGGTAAASGDGREVSGEVALAGALKARLPASGTLFIVAKSVDSPGAPVAVYRSTLGEWPVKFHLDDSQSMLPGHNLSGAGRVTVEARISRSGQAMPVSGDLRGKSGIVDPADHSPLKIIIDEVIS
jgi:cytochrome c-type biogenesis protein CcmH/NrfG